MTEQPLSLHPGASRLASTAATTTALGALACGVCCVLPFALPAVVVLAGTGIVIGWFGQAFWGALYTAGALVTIAWALVAVGSIQTRRRPAPSTVRCDARRDGRTWRRAHLAGNSNRTFSGLSEG
jgi:hypothetical protein